MLYISSLFDLLSDVLFEKNNMDCILLCRTRILNLVIDNNVLHMTLYIVNNLKIFIYIIKKYYIFAEC